jgi:hypothetical protein
MTFGYYGNVDIRISSRFNGRPKSGQSGAQDYDIVASTHQNMMKYTI